MNLDKNLKENIYTYSDEGESTDNRINLDKMMQDSKYKSMNQNEQQADLNINEGEDSNKLQGDERVDDKRTKSPLNKTGTTQATKTLELTFTPKRESNVLDDSQDVESQDISDNVGSVCDSSDKESSDGFDSKGFSKKPKFKLLGIQIKRSFGIMQWLCLPLISWGTCLVGVYMNTQLTYMLQDPQMFDIPQEKIGQVASQLTIYSLPVSMVSTFFISYLYELFGRKKTLFFSFFTTSIVLYYFPYTAPHYSLLILVRCLISITMSGPCAHPLVPDYVQKKSRGKAVALQGIGIVGGELTAMGVLFNYTKHMSFKDAFFIAAMVTLGWSIFVLFAVKDPDMKSLRRKMDLKIQDTADREQEQSPHYVRTFSQFENFGIFDKMKNLTIVVKKELQKKPVLLVCIIGATITRLLSVLFSTYLILWIQGYVSQGILENQDESKTIYMQMMMYSVMLSAFVLPLVGKLCDQYSANIIIPFAFVFRSLSTILFWSLQRPDTVEAYLVCVLMIMSTIIENISIDSIFNKNLPKETRGVLGGIQSLAGQFGILIYSLVAGWMFDQIGPKSPFILIGILDASFAVYVIKFCRTNKME